MSATIVIDASVAAKFYVRKQLVKDHQERHLDEAEKVLHEFLEKRVNLVAPTVLKLETGAALNGIFRRYGRSNSLDGFRQAYGAFLDLPIEYVQVDDALLQAAYGGGRRDSASDYSVRVAGGSSRDYRR